MGNFSDRSHSETFIFAIVELPFLTLVEALWNVFPRFFWEEWVTSCFSVNLFQLTDWWRFRFQFILDVRLDYRISSLLSIFKRDFDKRNSDQDADQSAGIIDNTGINLEVIGDEAEKIFDGAEYQSELDLDGAGGKTFLRVLLHLTMHDYPKLVSGALRLLFRHFSQRQEVLQAFKQVCYQLFISTMRLNGCILSSCV